MKNLDPVQTQERSVGTRCIALSLGAADAAAPPRAAATVWK